MTFKRLSIALTHAYVIAVVIGIILAIVGCGGNSQSMDNDTIQLLNITTIDQLVQQIKSNVKTYQASVSSNFYKFHNSERIADDLEQRSSANKNAHTMMILGNKLACRSYELNVRQINREAYDLAIADNQGFYDKLRKELIDTFQSEIDSADKVFETSMRTKSDITEHKSKRKSAYTKRYDTQKRNARELKHSNYTALNILNDRQKHLSNEVKTFGLLKRGMYQTWLDNRK